MEGHHHPKKGSHKQSESCQLTTAADLNENCSTAFKKSQSPLKEEYFNIQEKKNQAKLSSNTQHYTDILLLHWIELTRPFKRLTCTPYRLHNSSPSLKMQRKLTNSLGFN